MTTPPQAAAPLTQLAQRLGFDPDEPLLTLALTHRSAAYEGGGTPHNERMEFLGDSVLSVIITSELYHRFPDLTEGHLARLRAAVVNMRALARIARNLDVGPSLCLGKGEETTGGRDKNSLLADALEALIGAMYLVQGLPATTTFVHEHFIPLIEDAATRGAGLDWKTSLQELTSRHGLGVPEYRIGESGPDHAKQYVAEVFVSQVARGSGSGGSKKVSEQMAAEAAWRSIAAEFGEQDAALHISK